MDVEMVPQIVEEQPEVRPNVYGERLLSFIRGQGKSNSQFARELGVPYGTIHRWLKGKSLPSTAWKSLLKSKMGFE